MRFHDLGIRMIKAGIDEVRGLPRFRLDPAAQDCEGPFGGLRRREDVGTGSEDGGAGRTDRERRIEAGGQDGGGGMNFSLWVAHAPIVAGMRTVRR